MRSIWLDLVIFFVVLLEHQHIVKCTRTGSSDARSSYVSCFGALS